MKNITTLLQHHPSSYEISPPSSSPSVPPSSPISPPAVSSGPNTSLEFPPADLFVSVPTPFASLFAILILHQIVDVVPSDVREVFQRLERGVAKSVSDDEDDLELVEDILFLQRLKQHVRIVVVLRLDGHVLVE
eukprot:scaffold33415_cov160-Skeletonema_menzelii.AAC.2